MSGPLVDWGLAERIATTVAGDPDPAAPGRPFGPEPVRDACADAAVKVAAYTGLTATSPVPPGESVDRAAWSRAGLATLRDLAAGLEDRLAEGLTLPGPLGAIMRSLAGRAAGAEAGAAIGYAARRVLGQYDIALGEAERPPRLMLVEPNMESTHGALGGDAEVFLEWVALHESTHALQFAAVPWLRPHLSAMLAELLDSSASGLDSGRLRELARKLVTSDPRETVRALLRGELAGALLNPGGSETFDRMQAAMAVIEGYAEHVMDRAAPERAAEFVVLRERIDARRSDRGGLGDAIARMLGLELKMRQYRLGKAFCDTVEAEGGIAGLNRVWSAPEALPSTPELEDPLSWLRAQGLAAAA